MFTQMGLFSEQLLTHWPSCTRFYAVDLWGHQENYNDIANVDQAEQENRYQETRKRLEPWKDKVCCLLLPTSVTVFCAATLLLDSTLCPRAR
jgi:hypothetical protein